MSKEVEIIDNSKKTLMSHDIFIHKITRKNPTYKEIPNRKRG